MNSPIEERPPVSRRYRIWVEDRLGPGFAEGCEDMEQEDIDGCTVLTGEIVDASQLYGVLDRLRRLGIEIVRFDTYRPGDPESGTPRLVEERQ